MNFEYKYGEEVCNSTCGVPYKPDQTKRSSPKPFGRTTTIPECNFLDLHLLAKDYALFISVTTTQAAELENKTCGSMDTKLISSEPATSLDDIPTWEQCANLCAASDNCSHWNFYANTSR